MMTDLLRLAAELNRPDFAVMFFYMGHTNTLDISVHAGGYKSDVMPDPDDVLRMSAADLPTATATAQAWLLQKSNQQAVKAAAVVEVQQ